jgi:hypothetical protein
VLVGVFACCMPFLISLSNFYLGEFLDVYALVNLSDSWDTLFFVVAPTKDADWHCRRVRSSGSLNCSNEFVVFYWLV